MRLIPGGAWLVAGLVLVLLVVLYLMTNATQDSARFSELYSLLLVVSAVGLSLLAGLIVWQLWRLLMQIRRKEAGARLTFRMVGIFVLLALTPVMVVYYFSLQALHRGIDSWFDVRIETALTDALELGRSSFGIRMREQLRTTESLAVEIGVLGIDGYALALADALTRSQASELTVMNESGGVVASSSADLTKLVPHRTDASVLLQVSAARSYVGLEPLGDAGLHVRAVVELGGAQSDGQRLLLQALYPVTERMNELAQTVQAAYGKYRELAYLREPLKFSFTVTLSLVLLLSILAAVWSAFMSARRMVAPLRSLAAGTQAVAAGDLDTRLGEPVSNDELGFLVASFNDMTSSLQTARDETRRSQTLVEEQRTYLQAVLERMSSGVITIDNARHVVTANAAAARILNLEEHHLAATTLDDLALSAPHVEPLVALLDQHFAESPGDWRSELNLVGHSGGQVIICRGTQLPAPHESSSGHVVVFDDITAVVQAQRNAAWSEVARRLAHEIKNPLTPIQLSAERLRHKYLPRMDDDESATLDRLTRTIVNQVASMKEMVNAFSAYARSPTTEPKPVAINDLVLDVAALYGTSHIVTQLAVDPPLVDADPDRIRQVLHNLIKNAGEAADPAAEPVPTHVVTRVERADTGTALRLEVRDAGPGIPEELLATLFEPYVTSKARGTGLGLAIVKKIVEEHNGSVWAQNNPEGGASIIILLPVSGTDGTDERTAPEPLAAEH